MVILYLFSIIATYKNLFVNTFEVYVNVNGYYILLEFLQNVNVLYVYHFLRCVNRACTRDYNKLALADTYYAKLSRQLRQCDLNQYIFDILYKFLITVQSRSLK